MRKVLDWLQGPFGRLATHFYCNTESKGFFRFRHSAYVLLQRPDGAIYTFKRKGTRFFPGYFNPPGGKSDEEMPCETALRELQEEAGIILRKCDLRLVHIQHRDMGYDPQHVKDGAKIITDFFYVATDWNGSPQIMEPDKGSDPTWRHLTEEGVFMPIIEHALKRIANANGHCEESTFVYIPTQDGHCLPTNHEVLSQPSLP
jgi:8-oxo-dGTP pyrophosphatase MutT (NUDIX family)